MVELAEIQAAYYMVAATGVLVAAIYYILNMKATLQTRQAQLFMGMYQGYYSKDLMEAEYNMGKWVLKDADDTMKMLKELDGYRAWNTMITYSEGIGVLVREGLIDIGLVSKLMSGGIISFWEKNGASFIDFREKFNWPRAAIEVEYLYNRVIEYGKEHPELKIKSPTFDNTREVTPQNSQAQ